MYDTKALQEAADCRSVASYIGMRVQGQYCECVSGLHTESQLNHCAIYKDGIHCFSCGAHRDVFGMVRDYYQNVLGSPITFTEVCGIIGDACGGRDLYQTRASSNAAKAEEVSPFTKEDLEILGLNPGYMGTPAQNLGLQRIFRENKDLYYRIIREKAKEEQKKITNLQSLLGKTPFEAHLASHLEERYQKLQRLYKKAGGSDSNVRNMFEL